VIYCVDVDYQAAAVTAACVGFAQWADATSSSETVVRSAGAAAEYESGRFYERELPYLTAVLDGVAEAPSVIVVDGYVWLGPDRPGLGARLYQARAVPVVGVAKSRFAGAAAIEIVRGDGRRPLYVTAVGVDVGEVAERVRAMHGPYRIPTLIKRADTLARGHARPQPAIIRT
jgi:deoxyribonuclease V